MKRTHIIIHCSDSPHGRGDNAKTIHKWHTERGFDGVGYHYVVLEDGAVEAGRPEYWDGAHTKGYNDKSIGICMIGEDSFTDKQISSVQSIVKMLQHEYNIPNENVLGHYETNGAGGKTCPNYSMEHFRNGL